MEKKVKDTLTGLWGTDDGLLLFQTVVVFYHDILYPDVTVSIYYVDKYNSNRFLFWTAENIPFFDPIPIEYVVPKNQYHVSGVVVCKIEKSETHSDLIVCVDIKYGTCTPYYEFIGAIYFVELFPVVIPDDVVIDDVIIDDEIITPDYPLITGKSYHDLFPFTYIHNWDDPEDTEIALNFITYTPYSSSPPVSPFYNTLCTLKADGDRQGMEAAALDFIENSDAFVSSILLLPTPVNYFNNAVITTLKTKAYDEFVPIVCIEASISVEDLTEYLTTPEYLETKEKVWLSYFALIIITGYKNRLLSQLTRTLQACHTLETLLLNSPPLVLENTLPIRMMLLASIILPADVFPVPFSTPLSIISNSRIAPYAIGDLQLVRQKLIRYEPGEIANIINVMPGEKKSIERRKFNQYSQKVIEGTETKNEYLDVEEEIEDDFEKEVNKTLADYKKVYDYDTLKNTYGAPTNITIDGSYSVERTGEKPEIRDITSFAKKILNSTTRRMAEKVYRTRHQSSKNEYEENETSKFENKSETKNLLGIYYWLNKVYLAQVVNYGNRFVIDLSIDKPAQNYINQSYNLSGAYLAEPKAPEEFGVFTFKDITTQNYAALCAYYKITDITLPPPETITVSESLVGNENKLIPIPKGYYASTADINYILSQDTSTYSVQCLLGKNQVSIDHPTSGTVSVTMSNENTTVPFTASIFYQLASPPNTPPTFILNTEIVCLLSDEKLDAWKISIYQKIIESYEKMRKEYYSNFNTKNPDTETSNPTKNRITVRNELKKQSILLLMEYAGQNLQNTSSSPPVEMLSPPAGIADYPRYEQFLSQAFDWNEMTYTFIENYSTAEHPAQSSISLSSADNFFTAFLQAQAVRVYLPTKPSFNYHIVFFLATGIIWTIEDYLAPLLVGQINLVNELKKVFNHPQLQTEKVLDAWEIIIPTSLQVLNTDNSLKIKVV